MICVSRPKTASTASLKLPFRLIYTLDFIDLLVKQIFPGNSFQLMKSSLFIIWVFFVIYVNFTLFIKFWPSVYQVKAREPWLEIQLPMRMTQLDWSLGLVAKFFDQNFQNLLQKFNFFFEVNCATSDGLLRPLITPLVVKEGWQKSDHYTSIMASPKIPDSPEIKAIHRHHQEFLFFHNLVNTLFNILPSQGLF